MTTNRECRLWGAFGLAFALAGAGCRDQFAPDGGGPAVPARDQISTSAAVTIEPEVRRFCGACHAVPAPETFPRDAWHDEVKQGYDFYYRSERADLEAPPMQQVVAWYRDRSPSRLELPQLVAATEESPVLFRREQIPRAEGAGVAAVAHLRWLPQGDQGGGLLVCDMQGGNVDRVSFETGVERSRDRSTTADGSSAKVSVAQLSRMAHPAHVEPTDLDRDGRTDYLVAELGSFLPEDHDKGQVVWIRPSAGARWETIALLNGVGRVADAQPGDFNGDGDVDLVVAEFGWRTTGRLLLLEGKNKSGTGIPQFEMQVLDPRHGAIHVPVCDLNADAHLDFVALISQEHEVVEAFLGRGDGTFERRTVFAAGDPGFGSSGIQLIDLDGDGDLDVLYTNGDTLDSKYVKPYHGVHWLENAGEFPFAHHELVRMPGVYRALAADLDGDGDLDIAACAYLPDTLRARHVAAGGKLDYCSLLWLEQRSAGRFVVHPLATLEDMGYVALETVDFNRDRRVDLAVGCFSAGRKWIDVWWNEGAAPP